MKNNLMAAHVVAALSGLYPASSATADTLQANYILGIDDGGHEPGAGNPPNADVDLARKPDDSSGQHQVQAENAEQADETGAGEAKAAGDPPIGGQQS